MKKLYPVKIYYEQEDNIYYADVPDLGLEGEKLTYGGSYLEAYENVTDALNLFMCDYEAEHDGKKPPEPGKRCPDEIYIYVDTEGYKKRLETEEYFELLKSLMMNSERISAVLL